MNKIPAAEAVLDGVLKRNPNDVDALQQRSDLRLLAGNAAEAEKDLNQVLHFQPDSAGAHFGLAKVKHSQGLTSSERQELLEAVNRDPYHLTARVALSHHFLTADDAKSALHVMEQTPPSQTNDLTVLIARNWALIATGNTKERSRRWSGDCAPQGPPN